MSKYLIFLLFMTAAMPPVLQAQNKSEKTVVSKTSVTTRPEKTAKTFTYEVKAKETLYSLCKRFNVTESELLALNPGLSNGLKRGQQLVVPVKPANESERDAVKAEQLVLEAEESASPLIPIASASVSEAKKQPDRTNAYRPRITVLLPFNSIENASNNERYIEFYEGFLLAVDSLKSAGLSFEVEALESGYSDSLIQTYLDEGRLNKTDYCVGGVSAEQQALLSQWARTNFRYAVYPFSSRIADMDKNPYLYQTVTPHDWIVEKVSAYFAEQTSDIQYIFLGKADNADDYRLKTVNQLKKLLQVKGIRYQEADNDETLESLEKVLSSTKTNRIIPLPISLQETGNLLVRLDAFRNAHPECLFDVVGYPDWLALSKNYTKYLNDMNALVFSGFYPDFSKKNVQDFQLAFSQEFGANLLNIYPRYGMMGYDVAAWFIPKMVKERSLSTQKKRYIQPLQHDFNFETSGLLGGNFNKTIFLIRYSPNRDIDVKQLP